MNLTPRLCYAWPDGSDESLSLLVNIWGWEVSEEVKASSWEELSQVLALSQESDDFWLLGRYRSQGWQVLFETRPKQWTETYPEPMRLWAGGLREIYDNLLFPMLEWTVKGGDGDFDLDILIQQQFFFAHVAQGQPDHTFNEVMGEIASNEGEGALLRLDVPQTLWPFLNGLPRRIVVFDALSTTLSRLGVPKEVWLLPATSALPTLLRLKTRRKLAQ